MTLGPLLAGCGGRCVLADVAGLSDPEPKGAEGNGVGSGRGGGMPPIGPDAELGAVPPLAGAVERLSGMNELPSVGGLGGGGDAREGRGACVAG